LFVANPASILPLFDTYSQVLLFCFVVVSDLLFSVRYFLFKATVFYSNREMKSMNGRFLSTNRIVLVDNEFSI